MEIEKVEIRGDRALVISVRITQETAHCKPCGREISRFHGNREWVEIRHLPILKRAGYIRYRPKRYECPYCDEQLTRQEVSWHAAHSPYTRAYEQPLLKALNHSTVLGVSLKEGVSDDGVLGVIEHRIAGQVDWTRLEMLGIDEIALKKGHWDFAVIVRARFCGGLNTPIRVLTRRCFGLFNLTLCFQRLWLDLERFRSFPHSWGLPH